MKWKIDSVWVIGAVFLLLAGVYAVSETFWLRKNLARDIDSLAQIIGKNVVSALPDIRDLTAMERILSALRGDGRVVSAALFTVDGKPAAQYRRQPADDTPLPGLREEGHYFAKGRLHVFRAIMRDGKPAGLVYVQANMGDIRAHVWRIAGFSAALAISAALVVAVLMLRIRRDALRPVAALSAALGETAEREYLLTLEKQGHEEMDKIIGHFNALLAEIRARGEKLERHKSSLKVQISVHTDELRKQKAEVELALREAQTASQSKSLFLANMSHELRTPLNAVIGYSEMLKEEATDLGYEDFVPDLQKINAAGKNLLAWIDEIIDLSRIESGRSELKIEEISVADMLREIASEISPHVEADGNILTVQVPEAAGTMKADKERVRRVLVNLLKNANKVTKAGEIVLTARRETVGETDWLSFAVKDSGAGINPKLLENLFKGHAQTESSVSSAYGGTALALAIGHRFSLVMGGNIEAESELGKGSVFTLHLPAQIDVHLAKTHVIRATNRLMNDILNL